MTTLFRGEQPLAEKIRPRHPKEVMGLDSILGLQTPLGQEMSSDRVRSTIFWGPPGCGKTTICKALLGNTQRLHQFMSAVGTSVSTVRSVLESNRSAWKRVGESPILVVDEVHRFNKTQQDAFLPFLEEGSTSLLATTTENPSFYLNPALRSRCRLLRLDPLPQEVLEDILFRGLEALENPREISKACLSTLARMSGGDARFALMGLEAVMTLFPKEKEITSESISQWLPGASIPSDRGGENHFNLLSAFHKSLRNSDPDASLYWLLRLLEGGEDPRVLARRMVRMASEDIGLADHRALTVALQSFSVSERLGMPECDLALAQAAIYLSLAPKSNSLYRAVKAVRKDLEAGERHPVPLPLRNPISREMKEEGYGEGYQYAHETPEGTTPMTCLPEALKKREYWEPKETGEEKRLAQWLDHWQTIRRDLKERK